LTQAPSKCYITSVFVDSHCHLEMEEYDADRKRVLERSAKEGVQYILTVATEERYFQRAQELVDTYPMIYAAVGIHPHNSKEYDERAGAVIKRYAAGEKFVAYGEIGLDFYRNYAPRETQVRAFRAQVELAKELGLPVIVHSRDAKDETLVILEEMNASANGGVMHCYSYDLVTARTLLDMGFYLSIPGTITYKSASSLLETLRYAPLDRILSETDAPFLTPVPHRGKRNEPAYVGLVVKAIAQAVGRPLEEVSEILYTNFVKLFLNGKATA
jgi:TatD DNase family protein